MDAFSRHKKLVNDYLLYYGKGQTLKDVFKRDSSSDKTDLDVIREQMKFVWDEDDEPSTWEKKLAKKYYDKLFKEYCICDLSLYKLNKVAMRWRIEKEVVDSKGQFICGEKKCSKTDNLKSWEVNFAYVEHGERKNCLVKLRLCVDCSYKLNFHHKKKEVIKPTKPAKIGTNDEKEAPATIQTEDEVPVKKRIKTEKEDYGDNSRSTSESTSKHSSETINQDNMIILTDDSVWKKNDRKADDKTREEEFEDYLEDLLL